MTARNHAFRIEALLRKVKDPSYKGSDEILLDPYKEITLVLEYRVPQEKLDRFKLYYQAVSGQTLQELIDENYDVERLLNDLEKVIENN